MSTYHSNQGTDDTLIAIPVYNEARYVDDILTAVSKYSSNILVVDDGSDDGTDKLIEKYESVKIITHKINQGYGQSLIDAFEFAKNYGYKWIITMDCDHQHEPSYIPHFYAEIRKGDCDIISGSRYLDLAHQSKTQPPIERVGINKRITILLNLILELKLTDSFCGFKAYRVEALKKLKLAEKGYALPLQLWIQAAATELRVGEIPVPLIYHDPKRNFAGLLEEPKFRMQYYVDVIAQELKISGYKNAEKRIYP